jgi:hypothetical protein
LQFIFDEKKYPTELKGQGQTDVDREVKEVRRLWREMRLWDSVEQVAETRQKRSNSLKRRRTDQGRIGQLTAPRIFSVFFSEPKSLATGKHLSEYKHVRIYWTFFLESQDPASQPPG